MEFGAPIADSKNVRVVVRCRPLQKEEVAQSYKTVIEVSQEVFIVFFLLRIRGKNEAGLHPLQLESKRLSAAPGRVGSALSAFQYVLYCSINCK